jgi:hypothetical protein
MTSIINRFLIWWLRSGRYPWSRFRRRLCEAGYLNQNLPAVTSLEDIRDCLTKITWTMDGLLHLYDAISYPQTVWHRKKDDCDGFAVLAASLLQQWHPDSKPVLVTVMLRPVKQSHTVCAFFVSAEELGYFDNKTLRQGNYRTYADIADNVRDDHEIICWDVVDPFTLKTIEFHQIA